MFGSQILVAPLLESGDSRTVYLPRGKWIDYQSGKVYEGGYQTIKVGEIPCVILVRDGSLIRLSFPAGRCPCILYPAL